MSTVLLEVVTPDKLVLSQEVNMVSLRGGAGELGILPRHTPLATTVKPGVVKVKLPQGEDYLFVSGGFLEVLPNRITILADAAEVAGTIDVSRATEAKRRAEGRLGPAGAGTGSSGAAGNGGGDFDQKRAEFALFRAEKRLEAVELSAKSGHLLGTGDLVD